MEQRWCWRQLYLSLVLACWLANVDAKSARVDAGVVKPNAADAKSVNANVDASTANPNTDSAKVDPNADAPVAGSNVDSAVVHKNVDTTVIGSNVDSAAVNKDVDAAMGGSYVDVTETACSSPATTPAPASAQTTDTTCSRTVTTCATSTAKPFDDTVATATVRTADAADQWRERVTQLTNALSKAQAKLTVIHNRVRLLTTVEKEKYGYVKAASEKVSTLVDNMEHVEHVLSCDTNRERRVRLQLCRVERLRWRASRKLQVVRRLSVGAEVGLVHLESDSKLSAACQPGAGSNSSVSDGGREQRTFNDYD